jgi:hypothetical protein
MKKNFIFSKTTRCHLGLISVTLLFSSCIKNTYFNTRAITPVFYDSTTKVHVEGFVGQGLKQYGATVAYSPINRFFAVASGHIGKMGKSGELGLGYVPIQKKDLFLTVLSTYGASHLEHSIAFNSFFTRRSQAYVNTSYNKFMFSTYVTFIEDEIEVSVGGRFNNIQYLNYYEKLDSSDNSRKASDYYYNKADSLSFGKGKSFATIDLFVSINFPIYERLKFSLQFLYSFHTSFTANGVGTFKSRNSSSSSWSSPTSTTYYSIIPTYKRLVVGASIFYTF